MEMSIVFILKEAIPSKKEVKMLLVLKKNAFLMMIKNLIILVHF